MYSQRILSDKKRGTELYELVVETVQEYKDLLLLPCKDWLKRKCFASEPSTHEPHIHTHTHTHTHTFTHQLTHLCNHSLTTQTRTLAHSLLPLSHPSTVINEPQTAMWYAGKKNWVCKPYVTQPHFLRSHFVDGKCDVQNSLINDRTQDGGKRKQLFWCKSNYRDPNEKSSWRNWEGVDTDQHKVPLSPKPGRVLRRGGAQGEKQWNNITSLLQITT